MPKKKRRVKTGAVILGFLIIIFGILIYCILTLTGSLKGVKQEEIKIISTIPEYNYNLDETSSSYVSELFTSLKEELEKEQIEEEAYAKLVSQIFLADFFTLNSALTKNDIGGVQFVLTSYKDTFIKKAKDTVYRYVENNMEEKREQDLPVVSEVEVKSIEKKTYSSTAITDTNAYYVTCVLHYKEDLGYQEYANLILVHQNNKLEIAVMK